MFLGFDIGNTNTVMGLYRDDSRVPFQRFRFVTRKNVSAGSLFGEIAGYLGAFREEISSAALSSVAPELNELYLKVLYDLTGVKIHIISCNSSLGIDISYPDPSQLGVDRIVNAEAALVEYGGDNLIVDIGTAATFCVVLKNGLFDGGIIAPGIGTTIKALAEGASNLPEVAFEAPERLVARDTVNAIKSGFYYGWISLTEGLINRIQESYKEKLTVLLTGGFSETMGHALGDLYIVDSDLTMKGICIIGRNNS